MRRFLLLPLLLFPTSAAGQAFSEGFPFYLPPEDSATVEFLPPFPASPITDADRIGISGDDFVRRGEPIRFWGANFVADGAFPLKEESDFIPGRFRKMGFNLARFHHLDNAWSDHGIFPRNGSTRSLDPVQLDRLEYLIAKLKEEGVYVNMNLHVSRTFTEADGVADADELPEFGKGVTLFDPQLIELQKEYAAQLLGHVNPYTGRTLAQDPVLAMVEITNENSLYFMWRNGQLRARSDGGELPERHDLMLDERWSDWLRDRYGSTQALSQAWNVEAVGQGAELIANGGFESGLANPWQLEFHGGAQASASSTTGNPAAGAAAARVDVSVTGAEDWRVQFKQVGLSVTQDTTYTVRFALRAEESRSVPVGVTLNVDPWTTLGSYTAAVTTAWQTFEFTFTAPETRSGDVRLSFTAGGRTGSLWVDEVSMRRSGVAGLEAGESVEDGTVARLAFSDVLKYASARMQDQTRFYIDLQDQYYAEMSAYLKHTLRVAAPITGTNWNFGPVDLAVQSRLDYQDNHAYWDHPQFPGQAWSSTDWLISNRPMVEATDGGTIGRLMAGVPPATRPYTISEYNHAFPNRYQTEAPLFLGAYASLHDVDGLMWFDYNGGEDWTTDLQNGFFSLHRNTAMMALMPSLAFAYRRGLIPESRTRTAVRYGADDVYGFPAIDGGGWPIPSLVDPRAALRQRIVSVDFGAVETTAPLPVVPTPPYTSDSGHIVWDPEGLLAVEGIDFLGLTGHLDRMAGRWAGSMEIVEADGFGTMTWVGLGDGYLGTTGKSLITLSSALQNTGMGWDGVQTVHDDWGSAPTEMRPMRIAFRYYYPIAVKGGGSDYVILHRLDGTGRSVEARRIDVEQGSIDLVLDQRADSTVWFGLESFVSAGSSEPEVSGGRFALDPPYPNPAGRQVRLRAWLPQSGTLQVDLLDLLGRRVRSTTEPAGTGMVEFQMDTSGLAAGLYHVRVSDSRHTAHRPLIIR